MELVYSGHYDPATDRFIVKTLTDDTSELEAALQALKQRFKIRIAYLKVEGASAVRPLLLRGD